MDELTGKRFNRITVLKELDRDVDGHKQWLCRCDCGKEWITTTRALRKIKECKECSVRTGMKKQEERQIRQVIYIPNCGDRMCGVMREKNISINRMSQATGISRSVITKFILYGADTSSARLAKMCAFCGVSMDYIMGLKQEA